jgi:hypothetical protein
MHLDGFQKMLALRGGLASIDSIASIRLTLFWIEHNLCAAQDIVPRFESPLHLLKSPYSDLDKSRGILHRNKAIIRSGISHLLSLEILDILMELSVLIAKLTTEPEERISWEDPNFPGFAFYPTLHKLLALQMPSKDDELENDVQELCRLGGLLFIAEVRRKFGVSPVVTTVQVAKLRSLLDSSRLLWKNEMNTIRAWALVMASCAASIDSDRVWAVEQLIRSQASSTSQSWTDIINKVSDMWWVEEIFSLNAQRLKIEYTNALIET